MAAGDGDKYSAVRHLAFIKFFAFIYAVRAQCLVFYRKADSQDVCVNQHAS